MQCSGVQGSVDHKWNIAHLVVLSVLYLLLLIMSQFESG